MQWNLELDLHQSADLQLMLQKNLRQSSTIKQHKFFIGVALYTDGYTYREKLNLISKQQRLQS